MDRRGISTILLGGAAMEAAEERWQITKQKWEKKIENGNFHRYQKASAEDWKRSDVDRHVDDEQLRQKDIAQQKGIFVAFLVVSW